MKPETQGKLLVLTCFILILAAIVLITKRANDVIAEIEASENAAPVAGNITVHDMGDGVRCYTADYQISCVQVWKQFAE